MIYVCARKLIRRNAKSRQRKRKRRAWCALCVSEVWHAHAENQIYGSSVCRGRQEREREERQCRWCLRCVTIPKLRGKSKTQKCREVRKKCVQRQKRKN